MHFLVGFATYPNSPAISTKIARALKDLKRVANRASGRLFHGLLLAAIIGVINAVIKSRVRGLMKIKRMQGEVMVRVGMLNSSSARAADAPMDLHKGTLIKLSPGQCVFLSSAL